MDRFIKYFLFLLLILLLFSCSAHKKNTYNEHKPLPQPGSTVHNQVVDPLQAESSNQRRIIVQHAIKSLGLPYKWGGQSPQTGFDCSGLIVYTHQKADIIIPRTAKAQFDNGTALSKKNLKIGDLIFFKTPKENKVYHVAIYIGEDMFVHAPGKGRKVAYGYMNTPYFKKHYAGSRSYL